MRLLRLLAAGVLIPVALAGCASSGDGKDSGMMGEPTILREAGPRQIASDAAEASDLAGFAVREPSYLTEGLERAEVIVLGVVLVCGEALTRLLGRQKRR